MHAGISRGLILIATPLAVVGAIASSAAARVSDAPVPNAAAPNASVQNAPVPNAAVSHAFNWETPSRTIGCGITAQVPGTEVDPGTGTATNGDYPGLQCGAPDIGPKHATEGDPFVVLGQGAAGRARIVEIGDDDFTSAAADVTLKAGALWSRYGITCLVHTAQIRCVNSAGHGFTLSKGHFTPLSEVARP